MHKKLVFFILNLLVFSILGCSNQVSTDTSTLTLIMPDNLEQKAGELGSFSTKACFAVNIIAEDLPKSQGNSCDSSYGTFAGLIPSGGSVDLETKQGSNRTIELYYVLSENGCVPFNISQGLGLTFGANKVFKIAKKTGVNFNQAQVTVQLNIDWPSSSNSLATLMQAPSSCNKTETAINSMHVKQASLVLGAARGTTANGSHIQVKVRNQKLDMKAPNNWSGRILPNRLGEEL
jgi:hypothetical protein